MENPVNSVNGKLIYLFLYKMVRVKAESRKDQILDFHTGHINFLKIDYSMVYIFGQLTKALDQ